MAMRRLWPTAGKGSADPQPAVRTTSREASKTATVATEALAQSSSTSSILSTKGKSEEESFCSACSGSSEIIRYETIHHAARCGDENYVAAQLRDGGFDPNALLDEKLPLLHAAIEGNHKGVLSIILPHNPDRKATFLVRDDLPPLDPYAYAVLLGAIDSFDLLLEQAGDDPPTYKLERVGNWLHLAIRFMQYEMVIHLRRTHPKLFTEMMESKDSQKQTPKQLAIKLKDRDALTALLGEKKSKETSLSQEAPTPFNPSIVEFNGGVGAGAMAFVGAIQVLEEQDCMQSIEAFLSSSSGVIVATLAALGCTSQEMQYWISRLPLDQMLDEQSGVAAGSERPYFLPNDAKLRPNELLDTLNACRPLCKGNVLRSFIEFMIRDVTKQKNFTLKDLCDQANSEKNKHHLIVPIRREDGQIEIVRSDLKKYANVDLIRLLLAAMATQGLYPPVDIQVIQGEEKHTYSDPSLTRFTSGNLTCLDDGGLPYSKRGFLSFSLSSSVPPTNPPKADASIQERALYIVSIHHMIRRRLKLPVVNSGLGHVIIDTRGYGISENPTLFINAGRDPTQKHFRSRQRHSLPPLSFTPIEREELSHAIEGRVLFAETDESFQDSRRITILQSPSGMGKSTLIHTVVSKYQDLFSGVFTVDYDTPSTTLASLHAIAISHELFIEPYEDTSLIENKIRRYLEDHKSSKPWLLICENCQALPHNLLPQCGGSIICCLTSDPIEHHQDGAFIIPPLTTAQALELLKNETQAIDEIGNLTELAGRLDNNAQALMQASRYIKELAPSIAAYLVLLGEQSNTLDPTSKTLYVALDYLQRESSYSAQCVEIFTHMAPDAIPEKWVQRWLIGLEEDEGKPTSFDLLSQLERCGLITYHPKRQEFSIHRKTRIAIQRRLAHQRNAQHIDLIVHLRDDFQAKDPSTWHIGRIWAIHAQFLIDTPSVERTIGGTKKGAIYQTLGEVYLCTGQAELAVAAFKSAHDAFPKHKDYKREIISSLLGLGSAALERHDLELAKKSFSEGLTLTRNDRSLEPHCSLLCGLGDTYYALEDYPEALKKYSEVVKRSQPQQLLGLSSAYLQAELGRAEIYLTISHDEGAVIAAAQILEDAEHLFRQQYKDAPHPNVARRLSLLARIHRKQEKLKQAQLDANKALTIYKELYPCKTHPQLALAYGNLATLYLDGGHPKKAFKKSRTALGILNHIYPDIYHPIKIVLLDEHAKILERLGKYRKVCDTLSEQAGLLVQHNPRIMLGSNVQSEAENLYSIGSYKQALPFYRAVASIYIHYDPDDTAKTLNLAAKEAFDEKSYTVSVALRENALEIDRQKGQPSTDFTALLHARIGLAYTHLENYTNAFNHLEKAIKIYGDLYPYAAEIATSPWRISQHSNVEPIKMVGHLLATVKLYKESAAIYQTHRLTEEDAIKNPLHFFPPLKSLAEEYYDRKEYSTAAHHYQSLTSYLSANDGSKKDLAYAYYRLATCQQKSGQKQAAEESGEIAQSMWIELLRHIPKPTPSNRGEEYANLLINLGKTQYLRWKYSDAAASFRKADDIFDQLIGDNDNPSKHAEWTQHRAFLADKISINSSRWKRPFDYSDGGCQAEDL